jgi:hypothetical protein
MPSTTSFSLTPGTAGLAQADERNEQAATSRAVRVMSGPSGGAFSGAGTAWIIGRAYNDRMVNEVIADRMGR